VSESLADGAPPASDRAERSARRGILQLLVRNRLGVTGALLLTVVIGCAVFAGWTRQNPLLVNPAIRLRPPGAAHWFGTDDFGRDVFSRVVYGSRVSLEIGSLVVALTALLGIVTGLTAGYFRAWDNVVMRVTDALMAIPPALLAIALMAALGAKVSNVVVSLTVAYAPQLTRVVRSQVLVLRESAFAEAAKAAGAAERRIAFRHVLPNTVSVVLIQGTVTFADAVLTEAGLSYLGVGEPPGVPSWGNILSDGRAYMIQAPWVTLFPGLAIVICVLGLNLFGDGLRDVLDPRLRGE
jgi:peptide/nickel transport system permease protein